MIDLNKKGSFALSTVGAQLNLKTVAKGHAGAVAKGTARTLCSLMLLFNRSSLKGDSSDAVRENIE